MRRKLLIRAPRAARNPRPCCESLVVVANWRSFAGAAGIGALFTVAFHVHGPVRLCLAVRVLYFREISPRLFGVRELRKGCRVSGRREMRHKLGGAARARITYLALLLVLLLLQLLRIFCSAGKEHCVALLVPSLGVLLRHPGPINMHQLPAPCMMQPKKTLPMPRRFSFCNKYSY